MGADSILIIGAVSLTALVIAAGFMLKAWQGWLEVRKMEIAQHGSTDALPSPAGGRIEIADLKERVRKLEAIANGIEL